MLALLNSFTVDGLEYIQIYPDHQDPFLFYYFNSHPRVSVDAETGTPLLSFMMIGRDVNRAVAKSGGNEDAADLQLGTLNLTTDLGLTEEERTKIVEYLKKLIYDEAYRKRVKALYKDAAEILENDYLCRNAVIRLSPAPNCLSGVAKMELLEGLGDDFKRTPCAEVPPALTGNFASTFYASFGPEGAQLMYDALKSGFTENGEKVTPTEAVVRYSLKVPAYVPPLKAHVHIDVQDVYHTFEDLDGEHNLFDAYTSDTIHTGKGGDGNWKSVKTNGRVYLADDTITKVVNDYIHNSKTVTFDIEDLSAFASSDKDILTEQLISSLITMVSSNVIPSLFEPVPLSMQEKEGLKVPEDPHKNDNTHTVSHSVYKLKDTVDFETTQDIDFDFTKAGTMMIPLEANQLIISSIPADQVDSLVKIVDISDPLFSMLSIPVSVNALFAEDNIFAVDVEVKYEQQDARTGFMKKGQKAYQFKNETEMYQFRAGLARDSEGKDLREYQYRSRIVYRGQGSSLKAGENTWTEWQKSDASSIVVSYEKLGFFESSVHDRGYGLGRDQGGHSFLRISKRWQPSGLQGGYSSDTG